MRVVFWGSPEFAVTVLDAVLSSRHEVVGVVTRPPRPTGRGRRERPTPVAALAESTGVPVLAPRRPRGEELEAALAALDPDVSLVAAYGALLSPEILALPRHGSLNVHASLLPDYRGAAPVTRAILDGRAETGITIMRMEEGLDSGAICLQATTPIGPEDTAASLTARLAELGGRLAVEALDRLADGTLDETPQDAARATYAAKVSTGDAAVDWSLPAESIERAARAFDPSPGAWTTWRGGRLKLFRASLAADAAGAGPTGAPGEILTLDPAPVVRTGAGALRLDVVQPAGARRMSGAEWARGRGVRVGERLGPPGVGR
ncbi:MAG TPA: methionyl-tRNA formyltransferase [Gemmatimonadota bacterium]